MSGFDEVKINNAVHDCLDRCYRADDILPVIAEFLKELGASDDWQKSEIAEVELAVHMVLHGVMEHAGDAVADEPQDQGLLHGNPATTLDGL